MIWCRKTRQKTPEFRCETCPDVVKIQNTYLCGRPLDAPVEVPPPRKPADAQRSHGEDQRAGRRSRRRRGRAVKMRDKVRAAAVTSPAAAAAQPAAAPQAPAPPAPGTRPEPRQGARPKSRRQGNRRRPPRKPAAP